MHHLAQRLPDPRNLILFIGFQAPGARGFTIKSKAPEVKLFGDSVPIRAQVAALEQFSDHADPPELLEWLHTFRNQPGVTYLVHGEPDASGQLRDVMKKDLGWNVRVAQYLEKAEVISAGCSPSTKNHSPFCHSERKRKTCVLPSRRPFFPDANWLIAGLARILKSPHGEAGHRYRARDCIGLRLLRMAAVFLILVYW